MMILEKILKGIYRLYSVVFDYATELLVRLLGIEEEMGF